MSVPNHLFIVQLVYATGRYDLKTHAGQAAFVDATVIALNQFDPNWGHLKKKPGQTNIHGHGEDSALYKLPDNQAWATDFIGGAGGPSPALRWGPDPVAYYKHSDWLHPDDHDGEPSEPDPPGPGTEPEYPVPPRDEALDEMRYLDSYYSSQEGLQRPNGLSLNGKPDFEGIAAWYLDVYQNERMLGATRAEARAAYVSQIRLSEEWRIKHPNG